MDYKVFKRVRFLAYHKKRERIIIIGSKKPFSMDWKFNIDNKRSLDDILEKNVDKKTLCIKKKL